MTPSHRSTTGARRRTTLSEVAARATVSPTTASLVLNGRPIRVPDETRQRVLAAAADLQYVPNALVRSLQAGRTGTLGVYVEFRASVWHNAFVGALVDGLRRGAADAATDVLLYRPPGSPTTPSDTPPAPAAGPAIIMDGRADAAVLWLAAAPDDGAPLQALARQRFPAVVLMHDAVPSPLGAVLVDERFGSRLLLDHLTSLGHRRIAYYAGGATLMPPHLRLRRDAFLAESDAAGFPLAAQFVLSGPVAETVEPLLRDLLSGAPNRVTVIVCAHEELAYRTVDAASRLGLRIPDDLSVAAWELPGPPNEPSLPTGRGNGPTRPNSWLTGIHVPIWEMGRAAANLALTLAPATSRPKRRLLFTPSLQLGTSTGPPQRA